MFERCPSTVREIAASKDLSDRQKHIVGGLFIFFLKSCRSLPRLSLGAGLPLASITYACALCHMVAIHGFILPPGGKLPSVDHSFAMGWQNGA